MCFYFMLVDGIKPGSRDRIFSVGIGSLLDWKNIPPPNDISIYSRFYVKRIIYDVGSWIAS